MAKKQISCKQRWAHRRNWAKFRVSGILVTLDELEKDNILSASERDHLKRITPKIRSFFLAWKGNNKVSEQEYCKD